jgi:Flp pilus assembly protein TadG
MQSICTVSRVVSHRNLIRDRNGNTTIEIAMLALPLLLFLFAIINAGYALWLQNALDLSVSDAARCASVKSTLCVTDGQIKAYAAARSGAGFDSSVFNVVLVEQESCYKRVSAAYPLSLPLVGQPLTLSAQACFPPLQSSAS